MNLQHQASLPPNGDQFVYPRQQQQTIELISITSDEDQVSSRGGGASSVISEPQQQHQHQHQHNQHHQQQQQQQNIPYHAREHSQPFTYGSVAEAGSKGGNGTGMLKMQSGLSSPSLVRKQLGTVQHQKVPIRNDFEEMLRARREKVDNEKYSISDGQKSPSGRPSGTTSSYKVSGSGGFDFDDKWTTTTTTRPNGVTTTVKEVISTSNRDAPVRNVQVNGYALTGRYEPVKRSNTMDYNRTLSSDGG